MKWIKAVEQPAKGITKIFKIISKEGDLDLGTIKWYSAWRCYAFYPEANTIFEKDCLQDITDFIKNLMEERKKIKESTAEMKHIKLFEEHSLTYEQAVELGKFDDKIKDHIVKKYDYNYGQRPVGMLGKYGRSLSQSSITQISKFAKEKNDKDLVKLLSDREEAIKKIK